MTARPMTEEQIDDLIDCLADAAVYRESAENPHISAADAMLVEARAEIKAALLSTSSEVRRLREALTPSGDTKAAYSGEFKFKSPGGRMQYTIPWETIKEIMAAIGARAALSVEGEDELARGQGRSAPISTDTKDTTK